VAPGGAWPAARLPIVAAIGRAAPWMARALALAGAALLVAGLSSSSRRPLRRDGLLILLVLLIGPGLLVNVIAKDHFRRPRPHRTIGLGGDHLYVPPLATGPHGRSFPSGDAAVGFAFGALALVVRRRGWRRPGWWLAGSIAAGTIVGLQRVAIGAHFVSDVVWAGVLTWMTLVAVDAGLHAAGMDAEPAAAAAGGARRRRVALIAGLTLALAAGLVALPFRQRTARTLAPPLPDAAWRVHLAIGAGSARVLLLPQAADVLAASGDYRGLGAPGAGVVDALTTDEREHQAEYAVDRRGLVTRLSGRTTVRIAAPRTAALVIDVEDGALILEAVGDVALPPIECRARADALRLRGVRRDQVQVLPH
jgi:lipid A 4'-phosphatase